MHERFLEMCVARRDADRQFEALEDEVSRLSESLEQWELGEGSTPGDASIDVGTDVIPAASAERVDALELHISKIAAQIHVLDRTLRACDAQSESIQHSYTSVVDRLAEMCRQTRAQILAMQSAGDPDREQFQRQVLVNYTRLEECFGRYG